MAYFVEFAKQERVPGATQAQATFTVDANRHYLLAMMEEHNGVTRIVFTHTDTVGDNVHEPYNVFVTWMIRSDGYVTRRVEDDYSMGNPNEWETLYSSCWTKEQFTLPSYKNLDD